MFRKVSQHVRMHTAVERPRRMSKPMSTTHECLDRCSVERYESSTM